MKHKATAKFKTLNRMNAHQGLDKEEFDAFMDGKTVDCSPPKKLVDNGYLERVKKAEATNGS